jgi:hypothetical protein
VTRRIPEFGLALLIAAVAVGSPLLVASVSSARRLALRREEHALCAAVNADLANCMSLHPGAVNETSYTLCRKRHSHADCSAYNPNWRGKP